MKNLTIKVERRTSVCAAYIRLYQHRAFKVGATVKVENLHFTRVRVQLSVLCIIQHNYAECLITVSL